MTASKESWKVCGIRKSFGRFPDKLTPKEVDRLYALNRRTRLKLGR